ncbi:MAG: HDOD domain-containing protein [Phycisphaerae bacterium]
MTQETMTIESASSDQARSKRVELIIRQMESLPTISVVATRLLQATTSKESSIKEVISLIQSDQSLTAKILGLTRKAYLGLGESANTVEKAVVMLGFEAVKNAVLSIQVFEAFGGKGKTKNKGIGEHEKFNRQEFWKHCLAVACTAQLIVEQMPNRKGLDPNEIFVCGLLHDLGKVALDTCLPKSFERVVEIAVNNHTSISDVERRILGMDHAAIGKRLADHWKLPDNIVHAIWLHHHKSTSLPPHIPYRDLIDIIYLADLIAREQRIGFSGNFIFADRSDPLAQRLGINSEGYQKILLDLRARMGERATLIGLDDLSSEELYQQALQGANSELGRLNQTLTIGNRKLKSRSRYFEAINLLHEKINPAMAVVEMLEHMACSVRSAFDTPAVVVYRQDKENRFLEVAFADQTGSQAKLFELPHSTGQSEAEAIDDGFLVEPPDILTEMITHYSRKLSPHPVKLIRLTCREKTIGGILVSADAMLTERFARERQEINALCTACALALGQSLAFESKDRLAEELLLLNRQMQEMEQKLLEIRCMAAVGELAAGAAHEMNNPLAIISGRAQLLEDQEADPDKHKALQVIVAQASRASEIITELMEFAKPVKPQRKMTDLSELLKISTDGFVQTQHLKPEQIHVEIGKNSDNAFCDRQQVASAIKEILTNAVDAAGLEKLQLKIQTVLEDDGQYVQVRISDNGPGMEPAILAKALDPFFSARKAGRGRGLGLSRAYRYVQSNNGNLWLESTINMGTTAFIRLPAKQLSTDAKG